MIFKALTRMHLAKDGKKKINKLSKINNGKVLFVSVTCLIHFFICIGDPLHSILWPVFYTKENLKKKLSMKI